MILISFLLELFEFIIRITTQMVNLLLRKVQVPFKDKTCIYSFRSVLERLMLYDNRFFKATDHD